MKLQLGQYEQANKYIDRQERNAAEITQNVNYFATLRMLNYSTNFCNRSVLKILQYSIALNGMHLMRNRNITCHFFYIVFLACKLYEFRLISS